jgi:hypothetical protein
MSVGKQIVRLHLKVLENVEHLLETSVIDGFRKAALFNALFRGDELSGEIVFFKGLKQMLR